MMRRLLPRFHLPVLLALLVIGASWSTSSVARPQHGHFIASPEQQAMVDDLEKRTFEWFWQTADPKTGLVPDSAPGHSFSSIAAVGFGLTAYGVGVERGYITREQAVDALKRMPEAKRKALRAEVKAKLAAERRAFAERRYGGFGQAAEG